MAQMVGMNAGGLLKTGDKIDPTHMLRKMGLVEGPQFLTPDPQTGEVPPVQPIPAQQSKLAFMKAFGLT